MLDPSEVDRIAHLTGLPIARLVDWKNRADAPFELRARPLPSGAFALDLNTPQPTSLPEAVPVVHGDYESRKDEDGTLVYKGLPGNTMGQAIAPDGRPSFGVAYDVTELDAQARPLFKIYFGSASEWFVKNVYHQKWNDLREVRRELEPDAVASTPAARPEAEGKERGRNPRDRARAEQRHGGGRGRGRGRGRR